MASTNKTPQLGLNQWAAGDPVLREDFNADNAKIEAVVAPLVENMTFGTYTGDGGKSRKIALPFPPRVMFIQGYYGNFPMLCAAFAGVATMVSKDYIAEVQGYIQLTDSGVSIVSAMYFNAANVKYTYFAIR